MTHLGEFLQILIQIISALADGDDGEGDTLEDSDKNGIEIEIENEGFGNQIADDDSKTDTQKLKGRTGA